jgi:hypothetical protein
MRGQLNLVRVRQRQPPSRSSGIGFLRSSRMQNRMSRPGRVPGQRAMRRGRLCAEPQQGGRARCCVQLFTIIALLRAAHLAGHSLPWLLPLVNFAIRLEPVGLDVCSCGGHQRYLSSAMVFACSTGPRAGLSPSTMRCRLAS